MANEPKVLNVNNYQTTTEKVSGGQGTSSATVSSAPKELQKSEQSQVGVDLTNVKGTATGNTEERSLKVSKDATVGSYVADTNRAGNPGRTKRNIVNTVTVEEVKALIKKYGGGDSYSKEQIDEMLVTIREGQYVKVDTTEYPTLEDFLASEGEQGTVYLYPVGNEENNYYQYIWEVSEWVSLGTTALDLSGYLKNNENVLPAVTKSYDLGSSSYKWKDLYLSGAVYSGNIKNSGSIAFLPYNLTYSLLEITNNEVFSRVKIRPANDNQVDLGTDSRRWKNLYLSGELSLANIELNPYDNTSSTTWSIHEWYNAIRFYVGSTLHYSLSTTSFFANGKDLGSSTQLWKDLYLSGNLSDGTNSVTVADLKALIDYARAQGWIS